MAKEKANLYQEMEFDSYAYAQSIIDERTEYLERIAKYVKLSKYQVIILIISGLLTLIFSKSIGHIFGDIFSIVLSLGWILGIYSYIKIGGIKTAFIWGINVGKFCWYVIPIFPVDLIIFFASMFYIPLAILFVPYIIIRHQEKQAQNDINDAQEYMKFCKPVEDAGEEQ